MVNQARPKSSTEHRHDLALRILDHQVVGPDGQMLGNVDDALMDRAQEGWLVTGLVVGPAGLSRRLPGKLGAWTSAIWRRLNTDSDPSPIVVPLSEVTSIGSAITVSESAAQAITARLGLELWLRRYVISRIPGATGGGEEDAPRAKSPKDRKSVARPAGQTTGSDAASDILRARAVNEDGVELGMICELRCAGPPPDQPQGPLRVTHLQYTPHMAGSELGYSADATQGPLAVGALVRWWQRSDRLAPLSDVIRVGLETGTVTIAGESTHAHPHDH